MSALYLIDRHGSPLLSSRILDVQESATTPPTTPVLGGRFVVKVPDGIPIAKPANLGDLLTKKAQGFLLFYAPFTRVTYDDLLDTSNVDLTNSVGLIAGQRGTLALEPGGVFQSLVTPLTAGLSGGAANITVSGPTVTVTGLTGMQPDFVFNPISFSGSSVPANNGTFQIASYISPTSITITNPLAATDTGGDSWSTGPTPTQIFVTWDTYDFLDNDVATGPHTRQYQELPSIPANTLCQVSFDGGSTFNPTIDSAILTIPVPSQGSSFIMQLTNTSPNRLSIGSWTLVY